MRGDSNATVKLDLFRAQNRTLEISPLTIYEVGIGLRGDAATHRAKFERAVTRLEVVPLDAEVAHKALDIQHALLDQGERIGAVDILIAATAATREDSRILTRNEDEFQRVPGVFVATY